MKSKRGIQFLVEKLKMFPGVGEKTALRFVMHLLTEDEKDVIGLAEEIIRFKKEVKVCGICGALSFSGKCEICSDTKRRVDRICVVEDIPSLIAIEKTGAYKGLYHVLHSNLSPLNNLKTLEFWADKLCERIKKGNIKEVILATNLTPEGEAAAYYLRDKLKKEGIKITRLVPGIPAGGYIDLMDEETIKNSIERRFEF